MTLTDKINLPTTLRRTRQVHTITTTNGTSTPPVLKPNGAQHLARIEQFGRDSVWSGFVA